MINTNLSNPLPTFKPLIQNPPKLPLRTHGPWSFTSIQKTVSTCYIWNRFWRVCERERERERERETDRDNCQLSNHLEAEDGLDVLHLESFLAWSKCRFGLAGVEVKTRVLRAATSVSRPSIFMSASIRQRSAEAALTLASCTIRWASWKREAVRSWSSASTWKIELG